MTAFSTDLALKCYLSKALLLSKEDFHHEGFVVYILLVVSDVMFTNRIHIVVKQHDEVIHLRYKSI